MVGSKDIYSFVFLLLVVLLVFLCHGVDVGLHHIRFCFSIGIVSNWWHDR